jgi:hypothetical protein
MPRPRRDGQPPKPTNKRTLTPLYVEKHNEPGLTWDLKQGGLALCVQPTGHRSYKCIYGFNRRVRYYHIADATAIGLAHAREIAQEVMFRVAKGEDPQANRMAKRSEGTFEELAADYVEQYAKRNNKSWKQADTLVSRYLVPKWGKLQAAEITGQDVDRIIANLAPILGNQVCASGSAIFSWAIKKRILTNNPFKGVERAKTKSRERTLSDSEIPLFWKAFSEQKGPDGGACRGNPRGCGKGPRTSVIIKCGFPKSRVPSSSN